MSETADGRSSQIFFFYPFGADNRANIPFPLIHAPGQLKALIRHRLLHAPRQKVTQRLTRDTPHSRHRQNLPNGGGSPVL